MRSLSSSSVRNGRKHRENLWLRVLLEAVGAMLLILSVTAISPALGDGAEEHQVSGALEIEPVDFQPLDMDVSEEDATEDSDSEDAMEPPAEDAEDPNEAENGEESAEPFIYENCDAARDAGASNIREGEHGYGPHLDRDSDGIACEEQPSMTQGEYENCDAARADGRSDIPATDPEYAEHLDRDKDGIACESS